MKVISPAGDFEIKVNDSSVEGDYVVLSGQMGVWDSKIYMTPSDIWQFTSIFLRPSVLLYMLKMPFRSLFGTPVKEKNTEEEEK